MRDGPLERLDDYVRGAPHDDDDAYEADLFARALEGAAPELVALDSLSASLRDSARRGTLPNFATAAQVERLRPEDGGRVAFVNPMTGHWPVTEATELLVIKVPLELAGVERVDVENVIVGVGPVKTMPDVVFEAGDNALYLCCEASLAARADAMGAVITRFWGHQAGEKRLLFELNWASPNGV